MIKLLSWIFLTGVFGIKLYLHVFILVLVVLEII